MYKKLVTYGDVPYKKVNKRELKLNIMMPIENKFSKIPVVVFLHGGAWVQGDPTAVVTRTRKHTTPELLKAGYCVIAAEYSLLNGKRIFPQNIEDVKDIIRWVRKNALKYNFDENNIGILGSSAGAHLGLLVGYTDENLFKGDENLSDYSAKINYIININGLSDLLDFIQESELGREITPLIFGKDFSVNNITEKEIEMINSYSPINYVNENNIPTLIFHGTADGLVPIIQSEILYNKSIENGNKCKFIPIKDADHGLEPISKENLEMVTKESLEFISSTIGSDI